MDNQNTVKPRYKKKGPIRVEALGPFIVVSVLVYLYFTFLFDFQMRKSLEWLASKMNGAEVNIGTLKTSFFRGSLLIENIQATQLENPVRNKVHVGDIQFRFLWDALLRAKFVVEVAAIHDIRTNTPRKTPGKVFPPEPEKSDAGESWLGSMSVKILDRAKEEFRGSALSDAAKLLEGFDPSQQLKNIGELKTKVRIENLQNQFNQKQAEWNHALTSLPSDQEIQSFQKRINSVQVGKTSNPAEIQSQVNQVTSVISDAQSKTDLVKAKGEFLEKDVGAFHQSVQELDSLIQQDKSDLESRLKLPKLDSKNLAQQLFGAEVLDWVGEVQKYVGLARKYMPAKSAKREEKEDSRPPRGKGKSYVFGRPNSYPSFWLKKAEVNSRAEMSSESGNFQGFITDLSTSPDMIGRPAVLSLDGSFPVQKIEQLSFRVTLDHTQEVPTEMIKIRIGSFPVSKKILSESDELKFGFSSAIGSAGLEGALKGDFISLIAESDFRKIDYQVSSKSKILQSTLREVTSSIPSVGVQAKLSGTWNSPKISIQSTLAAALQKGFEKQLHARLDEARKKIDELIHSQVDSRKKELTDKVGSAKAQFTAQVEEKKRKIEELKNQANVKLAAVKSQATSVKVPSKDAVKKKFGF